MISVSPTALMALIDLTPALAADLLSARFLKFTEKSDIS